MLFCAFLLALWCKALIFSTKHRFLEKNLVSALFTINPKVSFKSKNVKLFKEIDKKFYLKLIKLFSYRRYAADLSGVWDSRWLSPSVKELSPQSGLLSKALRSSDNCHKKPRKRRQLFSVGRQPHVQIHIHIQIHVQIHVQIQIQIHTTAE